MLSAPATTDPVTTTTKSKPPGREYYGKEGNQNLFASDVQETDDGSLAEEVPGWKLTWRRVLQSTPYAIILVFFNVCSIGLFIFAVVVMDNERGDALAARWVVGAVVINALFLTDLVFHCVLFGFKKVIKQKTDYLLECVLQVGAITSTVIFYTMGFQQKVTTVSVLCVILMLRYLRLLSYAAELTDFLKIVETFKRFSTPFGHLLATLYTVMFFFSIIG